MLDLLSVTLCNVYAVQDNVYNVYNYTLYTIQYTHISTRQYHRYCIMYNINIV